eukprot:1158931-Pelagomonas_calceolata.AAC.5
MCVCVHPNHVYVWRGLQVSWSGGYALSKEVQSAQETAVSRLLRIGQVPFAHFLRDSLFDGLLQETTRPLKWGLNLGAYKKVNIA